MSAKLLTTQLTTWTKCQRSKQLRQHGVSVVNDYKDTDKTTQTTFGKL